MTNKKNNEVIDQKYDEESIYFISPNKNSFFCFTVSQIKEIKEYSEYIREYSDNIDDDLLASLDAVDYLFDNERIMTALTAATEIPQLKTKKSDLGAIFDVLTHVSIMHLSAHKSFMIRIISLLLQAHQVILS